MSMPPSPGACQLFLEAWARQRLGPSVEVRFEPTGAVRQPAEHFVVRYSWTAKRVILSTAFRIPLTEAQRACDEQRTDILDALLDESRGLLPP